MNRAPASTFPGDWPPGCPPPEAGPASGDDHRIVRTEPASSDDFRSHLEPTDVLVDVDGPRLFVARTPAGDTILVYHWAEDEAHLTWIAVPTDAPTVERVRAGHVALLDALRQPWTWRVTQAFDGTVECVERVCLDDLPATTLPAPGLTLAPSEEPFLAVRAATTVAAPRRPTAT